MRGCLRVGQPRRYRMQSNLQRACYVYLATLRNAVRRRQAIYADLACYGLSALTASLCRGCSLSAAVTEGASADAETESLRPHKTFKTSCSLTACTQRIEWDRD